MDGLRPRRLLLWMTRRTNATSHRRRGHRRTTCYRSNNARLRENHMVHHRGKRLGTNVVHPLVLGLSAPRGTSGRYGTSVYLNWIRRAREVRGNGTIIVRCCQKELWRTASTRQARPDWMCYGRRHPADKIMRFSITLGVKKCGGMRANYLRGRGVLVPVGGPQLGTDERVDRIT